MYKLFGLPMIEHVRRRVLDSGLIEILLLLQVIKEILEAVKHYGGEVKETHKDHLNGTSRVAEAAEDIDCTHVIVIQGDEPLIQKEHLKKLTDAIILNPDIDSWNSISDLTSEKELNNINVVKAALNEEGQILYFLESHLLMLNSIIKSSILKKYRDLLLTRKMFCWKLQILRFNHRKI